MRRLSLGLIIAALATPAIATATPTKDACIAAFDQGQSARRAGHLRQARESLVVCAQQECPAVVRADCSDVLRQTETALPTIVLRARDAKGADLTDVSVELNGVVLASSLDGRAVNVDPGKMSLVFKRAPWAPVTVDVVIVEAEKNRIVKATLGPPAPAAPTSPATTPIPPPTGRELIGYAVPAAFLSMGAVCPFFAGIIRIGLASDADGARKTCGPACPESERAHLSNDLVAANVLLGIGIGGLVMAPITWLLLDPKKPVSTAVLLGGPVAW